jgi:hypothetical protein
MSNTAVSKIAQLLTNQQRFVDQVEVAAGLLVPTYRGIPLIKSSMTNTRSNQVGTVTTTPSSSGGSLATATYYYKVSAVISRGAEIQASAEATAAVTGPTGSVLLSFSTPTGVDGLQPILYKVYRSTSTGAETLLGVVDAVVGLNTDGISPILTTSILDDGVKLTPKNGSTVPTSSPAAYVGTSTGMKPPVAGSEPIYLMSRDDNFICRPYVRELTPLDIYPTTSSPDSLPYALIADCVLAVRAPKYIGKLTGVNASV